jgi:hypothetical protein
VALSPGTAHAGQTPEGMRAQKKSFGHHGGRDRPQRDAPPTGDAQGQKSEPPPGEPVVTRQPVSTPSWNARWAGDRDAHVSIRSYAPGQLVLLHFNQGSQPSPAQMVVNAVLATGERPVELDGRKLFDWAARSTVGARQQQEAGRKLLSDVVKGLGGEITERKDERGHVLIRYAPERPASGIHRSRSVPERLPGKRPPESLGTPPHVGVTTSRWRNDRGEHVQVLTAAWSMTGPHMEFQRLDGNGVEIHTFSPRVGTWPEYRDVPQRQAVEMIVKAFQAHKIHRPRFIRGAPLVDEAMQQAREQGVHPSRTETGQVVASAISLLGGRIAGWLDKSAADGGPTVTVEYPSLHRSKSLPAR